MHFQLLVLARDAAFSPEKTSALLSIAKVNHAKAVGVSGEGEGGGAGRWVSAHEACNGNGDYGGEWSLPSL